MDIIIPQSDKSSVLVGFVNRELNDGSYEIGISANDTFKTRVKNIRAIPLNTLEGVNGIVVNVGGTNFFLSGESMKILGQVKLVDEATSVMDVDLYRRGTTKLVKNTDGTYTPEQLNPSEAVKAVTEEWGADPYDIGTWVKCYKLNQVWYIERPCGAGTGTISVPELIGDFFFDSFDHMKFALWNGNGFASNGSVAIQQAIGVVKGPEISPYPMWSNNDTNCLLSSKVAIKAKNFGVKVQMFPKLTLSQNQYNDMFFYVTIGGTFIPGTENVGSEAVSAQVPKSYAMGFYGFCSVNRITGVITNTTIHVNKVGGSQVDTYRFPTDIQTTGETITFCVEVIDNNIDISFGTGTVVDNDHYSLIAPIELNNLEQVGIGQKYPSLEYGFSDYGNGICDQEHLALGYVKAYSLEKLDASDNVYSIRDEVVDSGYGWLKPTAQIISEYKDSYHIAIQNEGVVSGYYYFNDGYTSFETTVTQAYEKGATSWINVGSAIEADSVVLIGKTTYIVNASSGTQIILDKALTSAVAAAAKVTAYLNV